MLPGARPTETANSNVRGFRVFCLGHIASAVPGSRGDDYQNV